MEKEFMYRVNLLSNIIRKHEIIKKTGKIIHFKLDESERKEKIENQFHNWFNTENEAREYLIKRIDEEINRAEKQSFKLRRERDRLYSELIESLTKEL